MSDEPLAYVGICRCGAIRAACVDERGTPERIKDTAKFCAQIVRDGLTLDRWTCEAVRSGRWKCTESGTDDCAQRMESKVAAKAARRAKALKAQTTLI